jgi:hypothetical protein
VTAQLQLINIIIIIIIIIIIKSINKSLLLYVRANDYSDSTL